MASGVPVVGLTTGLPWVRHAGKDHQLAVGVSPVMGVQPNGEGVPRRKPV